MSGALGRAADRGRPIGRSPAWPALLPDLLFPPPFPAEQQGTSRLGASSTGATDTRAALACLRWSVPTTSAAGPGAAPVDFHITLPFSFMFTFSSPPRSDHLFSHPRSLCCCVYPPPLFPVCVLPTVLQSRCCKSPWTASCKNYLDSWDWWRQAAANGC